MALTTTDETAAEDNAATSKSNKNGQMNVKNCDDTGNAKLIKLPDNLESVPKADHFPTQRHRWNTNEEIAAILICFEKHEEWLSKEVKIRPKSGSMLLYSRKKVRYRRDGYCWKKRKDGKTTREDHMKLKVQGTECIYGCYVHSAILPTFHRRCYWLLQNPDIVLVHYLNVPYSDDNKLVISPSLNFCGDKKEWTKDELISQLKPMLTKKFSFVDSTAVFSENEPDFNNELEISTAETVEAIVQQLMEKQRARAHVKTHECVCDTKAPATTTPCDLKCNHTLHRIISPKTGSSASTISTQPTSNAPPPTTTTSTTTSAAANATTYGTLASKVTSNGTTNTLHSRGGVTTSTSSSRAARAAAAAAAAAAVAAAATSTTTTNLRLAPSCLPHLSSDSCVNNGPTAVGTGGSTTVGSGSASNGSAATPLILNLSQLRGGGGLLILNGTSASGMGVGVAPTSLTPLTLASFVCSQGQGSVPGNVTSTATSGTPTATSVTSSLTTATTTGCGDRTRVKEDSKVSRTLSLSAAQQLARSDAGGGCRMDTSPPHGMDSGFRHHVEGTRVKMEHHSNGEVEPPPFGHLPDVASTGGPGKADAVPLFDETLDLSQEDIQKTLSANLPSCSTPRGSLKSERHLDIDSDDLNPMDFIDNDISSPDEDVFVNLDAFDMLTDFPDLDTLHPELVDPRSIHQAPLMSQTSLKNSHSGQTVCRMDYREGTANITDYSPEWSYPEGGVKVLVTGPWYSTTSPYSVLFDAVAVPTTLIQSGVLRCFCPAHEAGMVTLQVACEGFVISNSVIFEYKERMNSSQMPKPEDWLTVDEGLFKFSLLDKLDKMESKLLLKSGSRENLNFKGSVYCQEAQQRSFEVRLVNCCQRLMKAVWIDAQASPSPLTCSRGMTMLHLATALGYGRLVCTLLHWATENPSAILQREIDPLSQDSGGCTPLMWACSTGHKEVALLLYQLRCTALSIVDSHGRGCLEAARAGGHVQLAVEIEKLERVRLKQPKSARKGKIVCSVTCDSQDERRARNEPQTSRADRDIFGDKNRKLSLDLPLGGWSEGADAGRSSPASSSSMPSPHTPVANVCQRHLSKRSSVDSGINVTTSGSSKRSSVDGSSAGSPKLAREDIVTSSVDMLDVSNDCSATSDIVLMDTGNLNVGNESPYIDVVGVSDEESDYSKHQKLDHCLLSRRESFSSCDLNLSAATGEQDSRVLTLAEQIIAALPDRIKLPITNDELMEEVLVECPHAATCIEIARQDPVDMSVEECNMKDELCFEFSDHSYRYCELGTPTSSLSPSSSSCLQSPCSLTLDSPSPPPTTADFCEFFQASGKIMEKDFSNLTLSDKEQRELYEAAKIIQKAYRHYKGRKRQEEEEIKERAAATTIQNYYRRYKQYAFFKQMTRAAMVIQNQFRNYCEHKRFKKSQAAVCIQNYYRNYRESQDRMRQSRENTPTGSGLKRTYSQRRQHQAARKIQQFMRQSKNKLQRERAMAAERENRIKVQQIREQPKPDTGAALVAHQKEHVSAFVGT